MSIDYSIEPIDEIPKKTFPRKERQSKYQPIIDAFLNSGYKLVKVETDINANYLSMVLKGLLKKKGDSSVDVQVSCKEVYLERL